MTKTHTFTYICEDCVIIFQTFSLVRGGRPLCPNCGDNISIKKQDGIHKQKEEVKNLKTRWTSEELQTLEQCVKGKLKPYQVVIMLGRSKDSVFKKLKRMKCGVMAEQL